MLCAVPLACGGNGGGGDRGTAGTGVSTLTGPMGDGSTGGMDDDDGGMIKLDSPPEVPTSGPGGEEECASHSEEAENMLQPADIIVVVDDQYGLGCHPGPLVQGLPINGDR